jgi:hypothetical protein
MRVVDGTAVTPESLLDVIVADDVLVLRGELCLWTSRLLGDLLAAHPDLRLATVDASGLTFIDLTGARVLAELVERTGRGRLLAGECLRHLDGIMPLDRMTPHPLHLS